MASVVGGSWTAVNPMGPSARGREMECVWTLIRTARRRRELIEHSGARRQVLLGSNEAPCVYVHARTKIVGVRSRGLKMWYF